MAIADAVANNEHVISDADVMDTLSKVCADLEGSYTITLSDGGILSISITSLEGSQKPTFSVRVNSIMTDGSVAGYTELATIGADQMVIPQEVTTSSMIASAQGYEYDIIDLVRRCRSGKEFYSVLSTAGTALVTSPDPLTRFVAMLPDQITGAIADVNYAIELFKSLLASNPTPAAFIAGVKYIMTQAASMSPSDTDYAFTWRVNDFNVSSSCVVIVPELLTTASSVISAVLARIQPILSAVVFGVGMAAYTAWQLINSTSGNEPTLMPGALIDGYGQSIIKSYQPAENQSSLIYPTGVRLDESQFHVSLTVDALDNARRPIQEFPKAWMPLTLRAFQVLADVLSDADGATIDGSLTASDHAYSFSISGHLSIGQAPKGEEQSVSLQRSIDFLINDMASHPNEWHYVTEGDSSSVQFWGAYIGTSFAKWLARSAPPALQTTGYPISTSFTVDRLAPATSDPWWAYSKDYTWKDNLGADDNLNYIITFARNIAIWIAILKWRSANSPEFGPNAYIDPSQFVAEALRDPSGGGFTDPANPATTLNLNWALLTNRICRAFDYTTSGCNAAFRVFLPHNNPGYNVNDYMRSINVIPGVLINPLITPPAFALSIAARAAYTTGILAATVASFLVSKTLIQRSLTGWNAKRYAKLQTLRDKWEHTGSKKDWNTYYAAARRYNRWSWLFGNDRILIDSGYAGMSVATGSTDSVVNALAGFSDDDTIGQDSTIMSTADLASSIDALHAVITG